MERPGGHGRAAILIRPGGVLRVSCAVVKNAKKDVSLAGRQKDPPLRRVCPVFCYEICLLRPQGANVQRQPQGPGTKGTCRVTDVPQADGDRGDCSALPAFSGPRSSDARRGGARGVLNKEDMNY